MCSLMQGIAEHSCLAADSSAQAPALRAQERPGGVAPPAAHAAANLPGTLKIIHLPSSGAPIGMLRKNSSHFAACTSNG